MNARRIGIFLALWSFGFALVHVAWALGWRGGMPDSFPPISERPVFLMYDVVAGLLMFAAAGVSVLLARGRLPHRAKSLLLRATLVGAVAALVRGAPALMLDAAERVSFGVGLFADIWFTVAGASGLMLWAAARGASELRAAADVHVLPGHPAGVIRDEEAHHIGDVAGGAEPVER